METIEIAESEKDFANINPNDVDYKVNEVKINVSFRDGQPINFILTSTSQKNVCCVSENELQMMLGRIYYVPVNTKLNSDNYNMKVLGDVADQIDVRCIKNEIASIMPLQHNIKLKLNQSICVFKDFKKDM